MQKPNAERISSLQWLGRIRRGVELQFWVIIAALVCLLLIQIVKSATDRVTKDADQAEVEFWETVVPPEDRKFDDGHPLTITIDSEKVDLDALKTANARSDAASTKLKWIAAAVFALLSLAIALLALMARAVFLISTPAPPALLFRDRGRLRVIVRTLVLAGFLIVPAAMVWQENLGVVQAMATVVSGLVFTGIAIFLRDIADRFGEHGLARQTGASLKVVERTAQIAAALMLPNLLFGPQLILVILFQLSLFALSGIVIGSHLSALWQYRHFLGREITKLAIA